MPKFAQCWFNGGPFTNTKLVFSPFDRSMARVPLGFTVRKQLRHEVIFRVRRGNGFVGAVIGKQYQDKYKYFVPSSINNIQGQPARDALTTAVSNWKNVLTDSEKAEYNKRAMIKGGLSGYNIYIGEYIKANI